MAGVSRAALWAALVAAVLVGAPIASGHVFHVTKRGDPSPGDCLPNNCSLREAVMAANARMGADTIFLPSRKPYRLSLAGPDDGALVGDLDVNTDPLKIVHRGPGRAIIDAGGIDRVFQVFEGGPTTFKKLIIRNGNATGGFGYGGGISARADVTLIKTDVVDNRAEQCGGGIHTENGPALVLRDVRVTGNSAESDGGGISHSCFGGSGPLTMERTTVARNVGDSDENDIGRGGGIYLQTNSGIQSSIVRSTFARNRTGSEGGGIYTDLGRLRVSGTTVNGNRAGDNGGGIEADGTEPLVVANSTISGNRSDTSGGGIHSDGYELRLNAVTIARNRANADGVGSEAGGGIANDSGDAADFTVQNSLIVLNTLRSATLGDPPVKNDCAGDDPFTSLGHNLLTTRFLCDGFDDPDDRRRANPGLRGLADNGGPTKTIALRQGSPAVGRASPGTSPARDQRGVRRRDPDIGAFERR